MSNKSKKSILNVIPPNERKTLAVMLVVEAIVLLLLSYCYVFVESDYKTVEITITHVEMEKGTTGRHGGKPAHVRFETDNGMRFDYYIRGDDKNSKATDACARIKELSKENAATIKYVERENIISLKTIFESVDYFNVADLKIDSQTITSLEEFESYNSSSFWGFIGIMLFFTLLFAAHPVYCVVSAFATRRKRNKRRKQKQQKNK